MKKFVYAYRDAKLGAFNDPKLDVMDKEHMAETIARSCIKCPEENKSFIADQTLYYLGTFDDVKGSFELEQYPELILTCRDYIKFETVKEDEVKDDGKDN